jgi:dipeptidyl-peptidase-4
VRNAPETGNFITTRSVGAEQSWLWPHVLAYAEERSRRYRWEEIMKRITVRRFVLLHASLWLLLALLGGPVPAADEQADKSQLTLQQIYDSQELDAASFSAQWAPDGSGLIRLESSQSPAGGQDIVRQAVVTDDTEVLVAAEQLVPPGSTTPLHIEDFAFSDDHSRVLIYTNSRRVWRHNTRGDYWMLDRGSRELRQLGGEVKPSSLMFAKFSPDGRRVGYVRDNHVYVEDLVSGQVQQLTTSEDPRVINGTGDWVYEEELGLRDGFRFSPDGRYVAYWQIDTRSVREFILVNNTDSLYPQITRFPYPKVGQQNSACRIGVVPTAGGATTWLDVPGDPRNHYIARMDWVPGRQQIVLQQLNRLQNTNRVMLADPETGRTETILTERDEAWVDVHDETMWLEDAERFTWISERDGWRHIYLASRTGDQVSLATPGDYDVVELLHADQQQDWLYFLASPDDAARRYLYRARLDGGQRQRLTPPDATGVHEYQIAPDGRHAIHRWSNFDRPPTVELVRLPGHETVRTLVDNRDLRKKLETLPRSPVEFFRLAIDEGLEVDAWCVAPPDFDPQKRYPLLVYVYGEPAGQTVVDRWGGKSYLWYAMLAQQGYFVMSFDNRGTPAPRGRAWRKSVYRKVGILPPADQAAALRAVLDERDYIDPDRIAVWGWSGGGSMSLNAIFKYPDLYHTAMSVAPVPNQRYYDTIYQERYMGLPDDNVNGYLQGSPINFADQLQGNLLIVHGTGDDNCHYQGVEALINRLILHNKPFTMMAYPNRSHSIKEGTHTGLHLRTLLTRYLQQHVPAGPRDP